MQSPRYTVGADSISARFAAVRGLREGHAPLLHAVRGRPAKWDCRSRPGERRAGCPHPAAPCGRAGFRGRDKSRPYGQILCSRQTGWPRCLPRFAGEGHGPPAGVRGRAGRADIESAPTWGVCGGGNVPDFEPTRCGGRERPPYGTGETRRPPGKMQPPWLLQTHVGDDARIVPGCLRRRGVREGHAPPLHAVRARPAKWACRGHPDERRAGCPHPAAPRVKAGFRRRDKSRPYE